MESWQNDPVVSGGAPPAEPWKNDPIASDKSAISKDVSKALEPIGNIPQDIANDFSGGMKKLAAPFPNPQGDVASDLIEGGKDVGSRAMGALQAIASPVTGAARALVGRPAGEIAQYAGMSPQNAKSYVEEPVTAAASMFGPAGVSKYAPDIIQGGTNLVNGASKFLSDMGEGSGVSTDAALAGAPKALNSSALKVRNYDQIKEANGALSDNTSAAYNKAHALGAVPTQEGTDLAINNLQKDVGDDLDPGLHPQTIGALRLFNKKAQNGLNLQTIDNTRKKLNMIAYDSNANANDVGAAKQAIRNIDNTLDIYGNNPNLLQSGSPDAIDALKQARQAGVIEQQHNRIAGIVRNANGNANKIQSGFKNLFNDEDEFDRFSPDNQDLIKGLAHPANMDKVLSTLGKAGFAGNGHTIPAIEATAALAGHPLAGVPIAVGTASNLLRNSLVRKGAENVLKNIEGASFPVEPPMKQGFSPIGVGQKNLPAPPNQLALPAPNVIGVNTSGVASRQLPSEPTNLGLSAADVERSPAAMSDPRAPVNPYQSKYGQSDFGKWVAQNANKPIMQQVDSIPTAEYNQSQVNSILKNSAFDKLDADQKTKVNNEIEQAWNSYKVPLRDMIRQAMASSQYLAEATGKNPIGTLGDALINAKKHGGQVNTEPSEAQIKAGNYKKDHFSWNGLGITIENPKGSIRRGLDKNGKKWQVRMPVAYGYIKGHEGADGDHMDVFVGPRLNSDKVWVIDQKHHDTGKFDEHKILIGFPAKGYALAAYRKAFSDGNADKRIHAISECSVEELKQWLNKIKKDEV